MSKPFKLLLSSLTLQLTSFSGGQVVLQYTFGIHFPQDYLNTGFYKLYNCGSFFHLSR